MFAYCNNDPISYVDTTGEFLVATIVGGIIGAFGGAISAVLSGDDVVAGAITGAVTGAAVGYVCDSVAGSIVTGGAATAVYVAGGMAACGVIGAAGNLVNQYCNYRIDQNAAEAKGQDVGDFSDYVDMQSVVVSGVTYAATSVLSIGSGVVVNQAFNGIAETTTKTVANAVADGYIGGSASLLSTCIDWVAQEVFG